MKKVKTIGFAVALLLGAAVTAQATLIDLDLSSGVNSKTNGAPGTLLDTHTQLGFTLKMDRAGDHFDPGYIGHLGFHNGSSNPDNVSWTLSFGGAAFSLLGIDVVGFNSGGSSFTVTGSNGLSQVISTTGLSAVGLTYVTSVTFNINQDGGEQAVGLRLLSVDNAPVAPAVPDAGSSAGLLAVGVAALAFGRKKFA